MTREKILEAAKELFEEKGFELATVREISAKAGVNVALINYHFGSKEQLLATMVDETSKFTYNMLVEISGSTASPFEKLEKTVDLFVDKIFNNRRYYQMVHRELSTPQRPELKEQMAVPLRRNRDEIRKIIAEGILKEEFRKEIDIELTITSIFGLMYQVTHAGFQSCKLVTDEELDDEQLKIRIKTHLKSLLRNHLEKK